MAEARGKKAYIRLDRALAEGGFGTRSEVKKLIARGAVKRDGEVLSDPAQRLLHSELEALTVLGQPLHWRAEYHLVLYKPGDCVTALHDKHWTTVYEYLPDELLRAGIRAVGRLDRDTTGLLFFTTDGELNHRLASPKYGVAKRYRFAYSGRPFDEADVAAVAKGLILPDHGLLRPGELIPLGNGVAELIIHEGIYHQVKRMVEVLGRELTELERLAFGPLELSDFELEAGEWIVLEEDEVAVLKEICGLGPK